nr:MAG TPA: hypothetical protein [Caudoviricetes sp.]
MHNFARFCTILHDFARSRCAIMYNRELNLKDSRNVVFF